MSIEINIILNNPINRRNSLCQWCSTKLLSSIISLSVIWVLCNIIISLILAWVLYFRLIVCHHCSSIYRRTLYFTWLAFIYFIQLKIVLQLIIQCWKYIIWVPILIISIDWLLAGKWILLLSKYSCVASLKNTTQILVEKLCSYYFLIVIIYFWQWQFCRLSAMIKSIT
jgi:hypothetical protein